MTFVGKSVQTGMLAETAREIKNSNRTVAGALRPSKPPLPLVGRNAMPRLSEPYEAEMARLTAKQRRNLPAKDFAGPNRSFPINDANHAKAALMLIKKAPPSARAKIRAKARGLLSKIG